MSRNWLLTVAGASLALGISLSAAQAAPVSDLNSTKGLAQGQSLVEKTHGWHRYCERGHRHVPGYGKVSCGHRHHFHYRHCWIGKWGVRHCEWR